MSQRSPYFSMVWRGTTLSVGKRAQIEKKRRGMIQFHAHGVFVRRVNADVRRVFDFAVVKILAVFQIKKLAGVIGRCRRTCSARIQE